MCGSANVEHLHVIGHSNDSEVVRLRSRLDYAFEIRSRHEFEELVCQLIDTGDNATSKTLDLIGHTSPHDSLLELSNWTIDGDDGCVRAFFRGLADTGVFARLGIESLRLLGCETARTRAGRETICVLASVTGLEVWGTRTMIGAAQYNAYGFRDDFHHVLVSSAQLLAKNELAVSDAPWPRGLDIDALPTMTLATLPSTPWPRLIASTHDARQLIALVRGTDGGAMPGLPVTPCCEIAVSAPDPGRFWLVQVLLDGAMVRFFPGGHRTDAVCYPTSDPASFRALMRRLSPVLSS